MRVRESLIIPCPMLVIQKTRRMSRFYSGAYKWSLYEKYRTGFSLTEICKIFGVTDKPLREWFRHFDLQYSKASSVSLKEVNRKSAQLRKQFEKAQQNWDFSKVNWVLRKCRNLSGFLAHSLF